MTLFPFILSVPADLPSRGEDADVYVLDINQLSLPTPFYSVLVSVFVVMALSTAFHSITSPGISTLSHSVLLVFSALLVPSTIYLFMKVFLSPDVIICG